MLRIFSNAVLDRKGDVLDAVLAKRWLEDKLIRDERHVAYSLLNSLERSESLALVDMQFLDSVSLVDREALWIVEDFLDEYRVKPGGPLAEVLSHRRIDGEFTDSNLRYLQVAIDDAKRRLG